MNFKLIITFFLLIAQSGFIFNEISNDKITAKKTLELNDPNLSLKESNEEGLVADEDNDIQSSKDVSHEANLEQDENQTIKLLPEDTHKNKLDHDESQNTINYKNLVETENKVPSSDEVKQKIKETITVPTTIIKDAIEKVEDKVKIVYESIPTKEKIKDKTEELLSQSTEFVSEHATLPSIIEETIEKVEVKVKEFTDKIPSFDETKKKLINVLEETRDKVPSMEDVKEKAGEWIDQTKENVNDFVQEKVTVPTISEVKEKVEDIFSRSTESSVIEEATEKSVTDKASLSEDNDKSETLIDKSKEAIRDFTQSIDQVKENVEKFVQNQDANLNMAKKYAENLYVTVDDVQDEIVDNFYILENENQIEIDPTDKIESLIEKSFQFDDYIDSFVEKLKEKFNFVFLLDINPTYLAIIFIYVTLSIIYLIQYFYKKRRQNRAQLTQSKAKKEESKNDNKQKAKKFYPPVLARNK